MTHKLSTILSNTFYQLIAKFFSVILTFFVTVLIIRLGSADLYGDLTKTLALITIGFTAIDFGLNAESVRSMKGSPAANKKILTDTMVARSLLAVVSILVVNLVVFTLPGGYTPSIKAAFWVGSIAIFFQGIYTSLNVWFQRNLTYWKMALSTVLGNLTGASLTYYVVVHCPSLLNLLIAFTAGYLVMGLTALILGLPYSGNFSLKNSFALLGRAAPLGAILLASIISSKIDSVILGIYRPSSELGQYGFAYRIFDVILVLPVFTMNSIFPLLVQSSHSVKKTLVNQSLLALGALGILGIFVVYPLAPLIAWIKPGMDLAISSLRLLSLSLPLFYLTAPLMWQLIEARKEKVLIIVYVFAAIFNGITNLIFAPHFGPLASAVITGLTELVILVGLLLSRRTLPFRSLSN